MTQASDIALLVGLNGGKLIGKTRLQKSTYLLESKTLGFGFDFSYHHYGPYSEELANLADDATALKLIDVSWDTSQAGTKYAVFCANAFEPKEPIDKQRKKILNVLSNYSSIELELAATADFLKRDFGKTAWSETQRRKAAKINSIRIERSKKLLDEIDWI
jgi:uncharacterized protein YwgA